MSDDSIMTTHSHPCSCTSHSRAHEEGPTCLTIIEIAYTILWVEKAVQIGMSQDWNR